VIEIRVPGQPQGKGRARFAKIGAFMRAYTPEKTVAYEGLIALAGEKAMDGMERLQGPVDLKITAVFQIPKGWSQKKRLASLLSPEWHTGKPDGDNILKAVGDGLNGVVWRDDAQIARASISKAYGEAPGLIVTVAPL
jgi:Holliday junction resolvase RusA-like endonuclease